MEYKGYWIDRSTNTASWRISKSQDVRDVVARLDGELLLRDVKRCIDFHLSIQERYKAEIEHAIKKHMKKLDHDIDTDLKRQFGDDREFWKQQEIRHISSWNMLNTILTEINELS